MRRSIEESFLPCPIKKSCIVIPIQEIEAWLLSDEAAIYASLNLKHKVPKVPNPESILDPKRKLKEIIHIKSDKTKRYINTTHNKKIASYVSIENIKRCSSFVVMYDFIKKHMK